MSVADSSLAAALAPPLRRALYQQPRRGSRVVNGAKISWLEWGDPARRTLVFIHGGAAHAWWWAFTAPVLADRYHVVAMDLSGHGDSDRRSVYDFHTWAEEALGVAFAFGTEEPPIVLGHSMGGIVASVVAGHPRAVDLGGVIVIDSPVVMPSPKVREADEGALGVVRYYPDRASAIGNFRLRPRQAVAASDLLRFVAERSVQEDPAGRGWTWRYDPRIFQTPAANRPASTLPNLTSAPCGIGVVVGEKSVVVPDSDRALLARAAESGRLAVQVIEGGAHHLMFDKPWELMVAITDLIAHCLHVPRRSG